MVALTGLDRSTANVSSGSYVVSPVTCTVIVLVVSPGAKFFFNDTATTEIYTLSLHDALPISTRIVSCDGLDSDTVKVAGVWPLLPSVTDTTLMLLTSVPSSLPLVPTP